MAKTIQIQQTGGPEVMKLVDLPVGDPGPGEIRIKHHACGLNFIDVYQRTGLYPIPLPLALGNEGAGVVEAVGEGVTHLKAGDRAAYAGGPPGAYCEARVMPAMTRGASCPTAIAFDTARGDDAQGHDGAVPAQEHAAARWPAGGRRRAVACGRRRRGPDRLPMGQGARPQLIGTAGSDEKCQLAKEHGAAFVINYSKEDFVERVKAITGGKGVKVVYDSVGKDTFEGSLDCLRPFGLLASFGNASGPVPPFAPGILGAKGSLYLTRQTLFTHIVHAREHAGDGRRLFAVVASGEVKIRIDQRYPLAEAAQAHRDLEARKTTGSTVLDPLRRCGATMPAPIDRLS